MKTRDQIAAELIEITENIGAIYGDPVRLTVLMAADAVRLYSQLQSSVRFTASTYEPVQRQELETILNSHADSMLINIVYLVEGCLFNAGLPKEKHGEFYRTIQNLVGRMLEQETLQEQAGG